MLAAAIVTMTNKIIPAADRSAAAIVDALLDTETKQRIPTQAGIAARTYSGTSSPAA
jgi:hypothetical protein